MLEIRVIMNSAVEEILGFKTCCGLKMIDQNLEILVANRGDKPVVVPSFFDLEGDFGVKRVAWLTPPGRIEIGPTDIKALYCFMDEDLWKRAARAVFYDNEGNAFPVDLHAQPE